MARLRIDNRAARRLWLWTTGLSSAPVGPLDIMQIIRQLGFLQIDTIRNVTRAHNHILWSRNRNYREGQVWQLLRQRALFEHFTHDASLIPMDLLANWQRQFRRLGERAAAQAWYQSGLGRNEIENIRKRIEREGPLSTHAFDSEMEGARTIWARPPHKKALDQMWYSGALATSCRKNFIKFYDLGERVFTTLPMDAPDEVSQAEFLCDQALDRLSFGTSGDVQRFWAAMDASDARVWLGRRDLVPLDVQDADGAWRPSWGAPDIEHRLAQTPGPTIRIRILNPFDPAIRDRMRLQRLFGFEYRNEIFVPRAKRRWGYYVYPLLQGDRFVGRCELKADRKAGRMKVTGLWPEPKVKWGASRVEKFEAELARFARFAGVSDVVWDVPRPA